MNKPDIFYFNRHHENAASIIIDYEEEKIYKSVITELNRLDESCKVDKNNYNSVLLYSSAEEILKKLESGEISKKITDADTLLYFITNRNFNAIYYGSKTLQKNPTYYYYLFFIKELNKIQYTEDAMHKLIDTIINTFKEDEEVLMDIIISAIRSDNETFKVLPEEYKMRKEILLNASAYYNYDDDMIVNFNTITKYNPDMLKDFDSLVQLFENVCNIEGIEAIDSYYLNDANLIKILIDREFSLKVLPFAQGNKEVVLYAISKNIANALFVSKDLINNDIEVKEIVDLNLAEIARREQNVRDFRNQYEIGNGETITDGPNDEPYSFTTTMIVDGKTVVNNYNIYTIDNVLNKSFENDNSERKLAA